MFAKTEHLKIAPLALNKDTPIEWDLLSQAAKCLIYHLRKEIERLEKKLLKLTDGAPKIQAELDLVKKQLRYAGIDPKGLERPHGYSYSSWVMALSIKLNVQDRLSYRQVTSVLGHFLTTLKSDMKVPVFSSVRKWVQKFGYAHLEDTTKRKGRYALIVDELVSSGSEKLLVILGVNLDVWDKKNSPIDFSNIDILYVGSKSSWTGEDIRDAILEAMKKLESEPLYVTSDGNTNLLKGIRLANLIHVYDFSHKIGVFVEKIFGKDEAFIAVSKELGASKKSMMNGQYSALAPPTMRSKARYLNLYQTTDWMEKVLKIWPNLTLAEREKVQFVKLNETLVADQITIVKLIKETSKVVKKGVTAQTEAELIVLFNKVKDETQRVKVFRTLVLDFIKDLVAKFPNEKRIQVSSDIIESLFGKCKYRMVNIKSKGITIDVIVLGATGKEVTNEEVLEAMNRTKWQDVLDWEKENMVTPLGKARKAFWKERA